MNHINQSSKKNILTVSGIGLREIDQSSKVSEGDSCILEAQ